MPEMTFTVRWPDGREEDCWSPSLVLWDHLDPGRDYPVADFVDRTAMALDEAAERVRVRFGFTCTSAAAQRDEIGRTAARFPDDSVVRVVAMRPPLPERG